MLNPFLGTVEREAVSSAERMLRDYQKDCGTFLDEAENAANEKDFRKMRLLSIRAQALISRGKREATDMEALLEQVSGTSANIISMKIIEEGTEREAVGSVYMALKEASEAETEAELADYVRILVSMKSKLNNRSQRG